MKITNTYITLTALVFGLFATGCYTQFETIDTRSQQVSDKYSWSSPENAQENRSTADSHTAKVVNEEDYALGYEDGWEDAEAYYFKDYETAQWYKEHGASLTSPNRVSSGKTVINNYYGYGYSHFWPHNPYYYGYYAPYWHSGFYFSIAYGWHRPHRWGWGFHHHYAYSPFYTVYPWGWGYYSGFAPFYGYHRATIVYVNSSAARAVRDRQVRTSGLRSGATAAQSRTRSGTQNVRSRTEARANVRSSARESQINSRTGNNVRSSGSSNVRSRSEARSNNRSNIRSNNRSSERNRGSVQNNRSTNRNSGNVQNNRSNNSSGGAVQSNRSNNRSSGNSNARQISNDNNRHSNILPGNSERSTITAPSATRSVTSSARGFSPSGNSGTSRTQSAGRVLRGVVNGAISTGNNRSAVQQRSTRSSRSNSTVRSSNNHSSGSSGVSNRSSSNRNSGSAVNSSRNNNSRSSSAARSRSNNNRNR